MNGWSFQPDIELIREIRYEVVKRTELSSVSEDEMDKLLLSATEEVVFEKTRHLHLGISDKRDWLKQYSIR